MRAAVIAKRFFIRIGLFAFESELNHGFTRAFAIKIWHSFSNIQWFSKEKYIFSSKVTFCSSMVRPEFTTVAVHLFLPCKE
ncbi:MAG TPA: hypothetical protein DCX49_01770 [Flavobacteriales bacterium]|nr:hypothetical protein [Flavobacteriales bacterium]